jgi:D-arabinose 1-dehydrogenase-like Zn-dependent alcohol dehydrogenase
LTRQLLRSIVLISFQLPLKKFEEYDVDIAIDACGVCASDVHTITGGWGEEIPLPLCVGHEVIGKVVKVGDKVTRVKVGDRAGIGAQIGADLTCDQCRNDQENVSNMPVEFVCETCSDSVHQHLVLPKPSRHIRC